MEKPRKAALYKKFRPKCSKNCTMNQNVQFDDEIDEADNGKHAKRHHYQPEHLKPRPNIVKKQLKEYDIEFVNKVDELEDEDVANVTYATPEPTERPTEAPIITFVASKNEMWNSESGNPGNQADRLLNKYSIKPKSLLLSEDPQLDKSSYKFRRSDKETSESSSSLSEDSILQVFRGTNPNRRNFLLQSFNTMPLPFPANLVKPWKSPSYTNRNNREGKNSKLLTSPPQNVTTLSNGSKGSNASLTMNTTGKQPGTEIHIFYSYRNPHQSNKKVTSTNAAMPTTTVVRAKEAPKDSNQSEIFTMRSSELLVNKNASFGTAALSSMVTPAPSVNLHIDYRYTGNGKPVGIRNSKSTTTPAPLSYQAHLYSNYSHYDIFESVKTTASSTIRPSTTTSTPRASLQPKERELGSEQGESISPKHNFISYSSASESERSKGIPSICDPSLNCKLPKCFCPGTKAPCKCFYAVKLSRLASLYLRFRRIQERRNATNDFINI